MFEKLAAKENNNDLYSEIETKMKQERIFCIKFNHALGSKREYYQSELQISEDGSELVIINRVPIENHNYILEADPDQIKNL
jgi:hypothetical protein